MPSKNMRNESRIDWNLTTEAKYIGDEHIKLGCLMRIADSLEKIENPFDRLLSQNKYLESRVEELRKENEKYYRSICAYRGIFKSRKRAKR